MTEAWSSLGADSLTQVGAATPRSWINGAHPSSSAAVTSLEPLAALNVPTSRPKSFFQSTKTYDHNEGLSCCFRQWRAADSHCRLLHGYALAFRFTFACSRLDERNWCFDFGGLKPLRAWLHQWFDHTLIVAADDPALGQFQSLADEGLVALRILPAVGCEATARFVFDYAAAFVSEQTDDRAWIEAVEVREHGGNSAMCTVG